MMLSVFLPKLSGKIFFPLVVVLSLIFSAISASAQTAKTDAKGLVSTITRYNENMKGELVFLHFDKPYYAKGDTVWFKVYLVESSSHLLSSQSGLVYVELVDAENVVTKRFMLPVVNGVSWGDIKLDEELSAGYYTIRGYTNWMRNFDNEYLFTKRIEIIDNISQPWLVNETASMSGDQMELALRLTGMDSKPFGDEKLDISLRSRGNTLYKKEGLTSAKGIVTINLDLADKIKEGELFATINSLSAKEKRVSFPVSLNRQKNADVQFLPESGYLVGNIPSLVGFKTIGEDGNGIDVTGKVLDQNLTEILSFRSTHRGMGSFTIVPEANAVYTAEIVFPDGSKQNFKLPEVKKSGIVLHVASTMQNDSLDIQVTLSPDMLNGTQRFHLIGQSRNVVVCAATFIARRAVFKTRISKSIFHSGIAHFTLFDEEKRPLNERQVFIAREDNLKIELSTGQLSYSTRDSIPLSISITDTNDKRVDGSFSVSVTDDNQVDQGLDQSGNIISYLQLTSRLKGHVEDPAYYFTDQSPEVVLALDNLLLTQGWVGYSWENVFNKTTEITYSPEPEFRVKGKIEKLLDKSPEDIKVILLSVGKDVLYKETTTDANGNFTFTDFAGLDTMQFVLKVRSPKNKSVPATIIVDEFKPLTALLPMGPLVQPWYVKGDTTFLNYVNDNNAHKKFVESQKFKESGERLNEVVITSSRIVKGSKNLNGSGADQIITEEMIKKVASRDLLHIIQNLVEGFNLGYYSPTFGRTQTDQLRYVINGKKVTLIIDGINVETFFSGDSTRTAHSDFLKYYLTNLTAPQIKGIEIMKKSDYNMTYGRKFLKPGDTIDDYVFFEITTYSGNGAFYKDAPGISVYRPLPVSMPREFYRPKYQSNSISAGISDRRSTIHWEPEITVEKGQSLISFYASDRIGTYTITVQGTDREGNLGYQVKKIIVNRSEQDAKKPVVKGN